MSSTADTRGFEPVVNHPDTVLFPDGQGTIVVFLDKEALLSWFTEIRSEEHRAVVARLHHLGYSRALFTTSVYQLVEVFTKVRYEGTAKKAAQLAETIPDSSIHVLHGTDGWDADCLTLAPRDVVEAAAETFVNRPQIEFSFPEATLVLALARENQNRDAPVYLFTFDGTLATLADTFGVPVLPYSTPLRDDSGRQ